MLHSDPLLSGVRPSFRADQDALFPDPTRLAQRRDQLLTRTERDQLEWLGYRLGDPVGGGSFALVLRAEDTRMERPIAIKLIDLPLVQRAGAPVAGDEMRILASLRHPHVVPLFTAGMIGSRLLYLVMPWIEGASLRQRLRTWGQLPIEEVVRIGIDLADALAALHERGLVHRDIKPENVLLEGEHAMVIDLGLVCAIRKEADPREDANVVIGTPAYMSPEQWVRGGAIDGRADVYALGCLLFELLIGRPPHAPRRGTHGERNLHQWSDSVRTLDDLSRAEAAVARPAPSAKRERWEVPIALDRALRRAMHPDRDKRLASARDFQQALQQIEASRRNGLTSTAVRRIVVGGAVASAVLFPALLLQRAEDEPQSRVSGVASGSLATEKIAAVDPSRVLITGVVNVTGDARLDSLAALMTTELQRALLTHALPDSSALTFVPVKMRLPSDSARDSVLAAIRGAAVAQRSGFVVSALLEKEADHLTVRGVLLDVRAGRQRATLPPTLIPANVSDPEVRVRSASLAAALAAAMRAPASNNNEQEQP